MPAEGEAVIEHMARTEEQWRARSLDDLTSRYFRDQAPPDGVEPTIAPLLLSEPGT
jgi:hypothetical protein